MELREWLVLHVKHKDAYAKRLTGVREDGERVVFSYKDGDVIGYALEQLRPVQGKALVATLQRKENIEELIKNWAAYARNPDLTIIFVNPAKNERWSIKPALHQSIADGDIGQGIWSLAAEVTHV